LNSIDEHKYRLHWLFADTPYNWHEEKGLLILHTDAGFYNVQVDTLCPVCNYSLIRADKDSPRGWSSPYYYYREPAISLDGISRATSSFFWTFFGPTPFNIRIDENIINIKTQKWNFSIFLHTNFIESFKESLIKDISIQTFSLDKMEN